jgi:thiamine-phosphate diphosphorylase
VPVGLIDYLGAGPIFATTSKGDAGGPIGVNGVRVVVAATPLPVAAIGGITLASVARVRETGATMAAVISALAAAADPEATARAFVAAWASR